MNARSGGAILRMAPWELQQEGFLTPDSLLNTQALRDPFAGEALRRLSAYFTCVSASFPRIGIWNLFPFNAASEVAIQSPNQTPHITRVRPSRKKAPPLSAGTAKRVKTTLTRNAATFRRMDCQQWKRTYLLWL